MKLKITLFVLILSSMMLFQNGLTGQMPKVERENIEWCDIWIPYASITDKPRILLIGDSITRGYYDAVNELLKEKAYCARFTTSACVADPAFLVQLKAMFCQYNYKIIHFNNGIHGMGYTEEEYRAGYEKALQYLQSVSPSSKIILALTTPANPKSNKNDLNPRIDARNRIVKELAKKYGFEITDLHSISKNHPEYYRDAFHYKKEAIELQSKQVASVILKQLMDEPTKATDKQ